MSQNTWEHMAGADSAHWNKKGSYKNMPGMTLFSNDSLFCIVIVAYLPSEKLLDQWLGPASIEAWMHRIRDYRLLVRIAYTDLWVTLVITLVVTLTKSFNNYHLTFYKQEILNALVTNKNEFRFGGRAGQEIRAANLSIC